MPNAATTLQSTQNGTTNLHCGDAVVDGVAFDGLEAGSLDHFYDPPFGHFYFAAGSDGVAVGELSAVAVAVPTFRTVQAPENRSLAIFPSLTLRRACHKS